jgi:excisionase family DNA binding protein
MLVPAYHWAMPIPNKLAARFMTIEQVAEELSVGIPQVRSLLRSGELRGLQIGAKGLWRIGVQDFEDYISEAYRQTADSIARGTGELSVADADSAQH